MKSLCNFEKNNRETYEFVHNMDVKICYMINMKVQYGSIRWDCVLYVN